MFKKRSEEELFFLIQDWNKRIDEEYRNIKYQRMTESPYIFFRATNHLYWKDVTDKKLIEKYGSNNTRTWIQGDLHIFNFGTFENDRGKIVYDINDFDDSLIADYQYDLWRLASSIILAAQENAFFNQHELKSAIDTLTQSYLDSLHRFRDQNNAAEVCFSEETTDGRLQKFLKKVSEKQNRQKFLEKWVIIQNQENKFDPNNPKIRAISEQKYIDIIDALPHYKESLASELRYDIDYSQVKDITERLGSGLGSFGNPRFYVLIDGDTKLLSDDRILDVKFQFKPTGYHYISKEEQDEYDKTFPNEGWRHTAAYIAMHRHSNDRLGWMFFNNQYYSVNERSPYRNYFPFHKIKKIKHLLQMATNWGVILATKHVQSYNKFDFNQIIEQSYIHKEEFENQISDIAFAFAEQATNDWKMFKKNKNTK